jgi:hypothetical protein
MGRKYNNVLGKKYDDIIVISLFDKNKKGQLIWECKCKCGDITFATSTDLERGRRRYCDNCKDTSSKDSPIKSLYGNYKRNAEKRNYEFNLTFEEFKLLISKDCEYCGSPPMQILKKKMAKYGIVYNGIDRRNNKLGYSKENSVSSCKFCNLAKSTFSENEFLNWIKRLRKNV